MSRATGHDGPRGAGHRIEHDASRCQSMGMCELVAPGLFQLDDDGHLHLLTGGTVTAAETGEAQAAVSGCPAGALRFG